MAAVIHEPAPDFTLADLDGVTHSLSDYRGQIVVLNFWSAECPWSQRADEFCVAHMPDWQQRGVRVLALASNHNESPEAVRAQAEARGLNYPVLLDPGHRVADLYSAETTPHLFVVDRAGILRYAGALDDMTFRKRQPSVNYLERALAALLAGRQPEPAQTPAYGCAIVRQMH